ncbi:CAP domain-containing protein [Actinoplanes sp. TBRC 11911]|uniref:CAP domain-containing protein n=1 Tax=Actinoplanes sp. TBRC 11911 TaxID=2729386 RepID=UPI001B7D4E5F|nr:CAP domain-containing protein [Actinoplanes sp. TBRC 11911]
MSAARFRYTMVAGATAVVIGSGFTVVGLNNHADAKETVPAAATEPLVAVPPPTQEATVDVAATPPPAKTTPTPKQSTTPKKKTTKPTPKATKTTTERKKAPVTSGSVVDQVLAHINAARADEGLGALTLDSQLSQASAKHNQLMIGGCGLSHQCSGEADLGDRFSAEGVKWSSAGENIGFGSSGSSTADIVKAANGLTDSMLAEKPPNDGHRKNLLNTGFKRIGLSIVRDGKGVTWMTQDFVN